jgi:hypothetical protein
MRTKRRRRRWKRRCRMDINKNNSHEEEEVATRMANKLMVKEQQQPKEMLKFKVNLFEG